MARIGWVLVLLCGSFWAYASDNEEIQSCLKSWPSHPFSASPHFRTIRSRVKVMGIGDTLSDNVPTTKPELVLVRPTVNVMSKSTLQLLNPNGWYCLKSNVAVMGKTEIEVACNAKLAVATDGTTVLGVDDDETGVTVLGKSVVKRVGCAQE